MEIRTTSNSNLEYLEYLKCIQNVMRSDLNSGEGLTD